MTLEELAATLPNGFHDTEIQRIHLDYLTRRLEFESLIWIGDMRLATRRETYRAAVVVLEGLQFLSMEPPDPGYPFRNVAHVRVDLDTRPDRPTLPAERGIPADCFASRLFVQEWNAFMTLAARHAVLEWKGEPYVRPRA